MTFCLYLNDRPTCPRLVSAGPFACLRVGNRLAVSGLAFTGLPKAVIPSPDSTCMGPPFVGFATRSLRSLSFDKLLFTKWNEPIRVPQANTVRVWTRTLIPDLVISGMTSTSPGFITLPHLFDNVQACQTSIWSTRHRDVKSRHLS